MAKYKIELELSELEMRIVMMAKTKAEKDLEMELCLSDIFQLFSMHYLSFPRPARKISSSKKRLK